MAGRYSNRLSELAQELTIILSEQEGELQKVTQGLRAEREAFVSGQGERLAEGTQRLEVLAARALELDTRQGEISREIGSFLSIPFYALTANRIAAALDGAAGRQLVLQAQRTRRVAKELEVERRVGETLLEWSSQCQEGLLRQITEAYEDPGLYGATGHQDKADKSARLFDAKV